MAAAVVLWIHGPIPQPTEYHQFADTRTIWGIPRFGDVATNLPFVAIGIMGLWRMLANYRNRLRGPLETSIESWAILVFFAGVALTGLGSAYYHAAPDNARLFWDRLPLTFAFMALFTLVVSDRISPRLAAAAFLPLLALGAWSVIAWHVGEQRGAGDLRLYAMVQFYPVAAITLMLLLFPARSPRAPWLWGTMGFYALAKLFELLDGPIYAATGVASGHNLKHLAAAGAAVCVYKFLSSQSAPGSSPDDMR
jgi:hypothetical protein